MTSGRRAKAKRRADHAAARGHDRLPVERAPLPGVRDWDGVLADGIGSVAAWCASMSDLADARRASHDLLIEQLGPRRQGGVYWKWRNGAAAEVLLVAEAEHVGWDDDLRRMRAMLREYGGWIVVAYAAASEP